MNDNINLYYFLQSKGNVKGLPELEVFLSDINSKPGMVEKLKQATGYKDGDYTWLYERLRTKGVKNLPAYDKFVEDINSDSTLFDKLVGVVMDTKKKSTVGGGDASGSTTGLGAESEPSSGFTGTSTGTPKLETRPDYHIPVSFTDDYKTDGKRGAPAAGIAGTSGKEANIEGTSDGSTGDVVPATEEGAERKHYYTIEKFAEDYTDDEVAIVSEYRRKYSELIGIQQGTVGAPLVLKPEYVGAYRDSRAKELYDDVVDLWNQMKEKGLVEGDDPLWVNLRLGEGEAAKHMRQKLQFERIVDNSVMGRIAKYINQSGGVDGTIAMAPSLSGGAGHMMNMFDRTERKSYSLLDALEKEKPEKYKLIWEAAQAEGGPATDIEQVGEMALSFLMDAPLFAATAAVGGSIATGILGGLSAGIAMTGTMPAVAEYLAGAAVHGGTKLLGQKVIQSALSGGLNLGLFNIIADATQQAKEILDNGGTLNDYSAIQTLNAFGHGMAMGAGLGLVSTPLAAGGNRFVNMYEKWGARMMARGLSASVQTTAELLTFSGIGAALDGEQAFDGQYIYENAKMLAGIKLGNLPVNMVGKALPLSQESLRERIKYSRKEEKLLMSKGVKDPNNLTAEELQVIGQADDIPLMVKYKALARSTGVVPVGIVAVDRVERQDRVVRGYRGKELVYEYDMPDVQSAERFVQDEYVYIKETEAKKAYERMSNEDKYRISEAFGKEEPSVVKALETPVEMRTPEQREMSMKFVRKVEEVASKAGAEGTPKAEVRADEAGGVKPKGEPPVPKMEPERVEPKDKSGGVEPAGQPDTGVKPEPDKTKAGQVVERDVVAEAPKAEPIDIKGLFAEGDIVDGKLVNISEESMRRLAEVTDARGAVDVMDFKNLDRRLVNYIIDLVNNSDSYPSDRVIRKIGEALRSSDRQVRIVKAMELKEHIDNTLKGASFSDVRELKRVTITQSYTKKELKAIVKINGVKLNELSDDLIDRYIKIGEGFKKGVPNRVEVEAFLNDYAEQVKLNKEIAKAERGIDVDVRMDNLNERLSQVEAVLKSENPTIEEVEGAQRILRNAMRGVRELKKAGLTDEVHQQIKDMLADVDDRIVRYGNELAEVQVEKRAAHVSGLADQVVTMTDRLVSTSDVRVAEALAVELKKAAKTGGVRYLSGSDLELLNELVPSVERDGVIPVSIEKMVGDIRVANNLAKLNEIKQKLAGNSTKQWSLLKGLNALDLRNRMHKHQLNILGDYMGTTERVGKGVRPKYDPIYEFFSPVIDAVKKAKDRESYLMYGLDEVLSGKTNAVRKYVVNPRANESRARLKERAKVGMLMHQLSKYHDMMNMKKRVAKLPEGDYGVVDALGEFYRDKNGEVIRYSTAEEAIEGSKTIPVERVADGRYFDTYRLMRYTVKDGVEVDNPKWHTSVISGGKKDKYYKEVFDEAYEELSKQLGEEGLALVRSEEDVLRLLNDREREIYNATKEVFTKAQEDVGVVAGLAGVTTDIRPYYFPAMSKDLMRTTADVESFINGYYANVYKTTGHILERTPYIQPVDLDVERVARRYVREMTRHRYLIPEWRERRRALDKFIKMSRGDSGAQALGQYMKIRLDDGMTAEIVGNSLFGNIDLVYESRGKTRKIPLTTAMNETLRVVRNSLLAKIDRPAIDYMSAIVKYGGYGTPMNTSPWNKFAMQEGSIGTFDDVIITEGRGGIGEIGTNTGRMAWAERVTNMMSAYGDNMPKFPTWIRVFKDAYKAYAKEEFDINRYNEDMAYRVKVKGDAAFDKAKSVANRYVEQLSVSHSRFSDARDIPVLGFTMSNDTRTSKAMMALARYGAQESANFYASLQTGDAGEILNRAVRTYIANYLYNYVTQLTYLGAGKLYSRMTDDEAMKYEMDRMVDTFLSPEGMLMNGAASLIDLLLGKGGHAPKFMFSAMYFGALKALTDSKYTEGIPETLKQKVLRMNMQLKPVLSHAVTGINLFSNFLTVPEVGAVAMPVYGEGVLNVADNAQMFADEIISMGKNFFSDRESGVEKLIGEPYKPERLFPLLTNMSAIINPAARNFLIAANMANREVRVNVPEKYANGEILVEAFSQLKADFDRLAEGYAKDILEQLRDDVNNGDIDPALVKEYSGLEYGVNEQNDEFSLQMMAASLAFTKALYEKGKINSGMYMYYQSNKYAQKTIDECKDLLEFARRNTDVSEEERSHIFDVVRREMEAIMADYNEYHNYFERVYEEAIDLKPRVSGNDVTIEVGGERFTFGYQPSGEVHELHTKYVKVPKTGKSSGKRQGRYNVIINEN